MSLLCLAGPEAIVIAQMMHITATMLFWEIQSILSVLLLWACGLHCWLLLSGFRFYSFPINAKVFLN